VQETERKKLADLETERKGFEETMEQFEKLKLE
jgi:valyl-tRNA synthetase